MLNYLGTNTIVLRHLTVIKYTPGSIQTVKLLADWMNARQQASGYNFPTCLPHLHSFQGARTY